MHDKDDIYLEEYVCTHYIINTVLYIYILQILNKWADNQYIFGIIICSLLYQFIFKLFEV